ncbi:MAG: site-specific DNA-methyltransferase [Spirochaetales bacterium]|nr:site-specific DNA-methyltransferase [Spirochaetales bacterium]
MPLNFFWDDIPENLISPDFCEKGFSPEFSSEKSNNIVRLISPKKSSKNKQENIFFPPENHLLIKYENLQVLKWLAGAGEKNEGAEKSFYGAEKTCADSQLACDSAEKPCYGAVNFIYIDPPYNTRNDFAYNDNFTTQNDRHSAWLSFMSRRLKLARSLLREDGCIFIAIDQNELFVLKLLCDQIFGEENFVNDFMWLHGKGKKDTWSRTLQQHTLCYARDKTKLKPFKEIEQTSWAKSNVDNDPRGNWFSGSISFSEKRSNPKHKNFYSITSPSKKVWTRQWLVSKEEMQELIKEDKIYWGPSPEFSKVPREKIFNDTEKEIIPKNIFDCPESTRDAQNHLDKILGIKNAFENPKPVSLVKHFIKISMQPADALILDFFAGSGTTFEAVCELNKEDGGKRKCILVQKPEAFKNSELPFKTIADLCEARCLKVAEKFDVI